MQELKYIPSVHFNLYESQILYDLETCFSALAAKKYTTDDFNNYLTASAVASSQIEGNTLDLNSYHRSKDFGTNLKEVKDIENLVSAYHYAQVNDLAANNLLQAHATITKDFSNITKNQKGKYREQKVGIRSFHGLVYLAVEPEFVKTEMQKLFDDIEVLLKLDISLKETLYYAAYIHFLFVKIHPFADGNGRAARLLEKWFLEQKIGISAWGIPSEVYYWNHRSEYYENLNVGVNYYETLERLHLSIPFLLMLQKALCYNP